MYQAAEPTVTQATPGWCCCFFGRIGCLDEVPCRTHAFSTYNFRRTSRIEWYVSIEKHAVHVWLILNAPCMPSLHEHQVPKAQAYESWPESHISEFRRTPKSRLKCTSIIFDPCFYLIWSSNVSILLQAEALIVLGMFMLVNFAITGLPFGRAPLWGTVPANASLGFSYNWTMNECEI